jgi:molybdopterin-guanine dinucleotide biosynthesis adapter protein
VALVKPIIFQVVGYQNSGKTTVTRKLIQTLKSAGVTTVTIKHHGHGGKPDVADSKDSTKHLRGGALASIVEGEGRLILQAENIESSLEDQIRLIKHFQPDVILIEGYKFKNFPKLLLVRDKKDLLLLTMITNVNVIMYWEEEWQGYLKQYPEIPSFHISDETAIIWLAETIKNSVQKVDE